MVLPVVPPLDRSQEAALRARLDAQARPPGSLGRMEDLAIQLALIAGDPEPCADRAELLIFAGDHGMTEAGVSSYPSEVTRAMVATMLAGRSTANAFASAAGARIRVVDAGVAANLPRHPSLINAKIRHGTRNAVVEPALTPQEVQDALLDGVDIAVEIASGADVLLLGEMGIGNSASASLILHRLAPAPLDHCIGIGAGQDAEGLNRKQTALKAASARTAAKEPLQVLAEFGGLEIVMMAGAVLGAAAARKPVLVDGFICSAAALAAIRMQPAAKDYCVFTHQSAERGHGLMLSALGVKPLLDLNLRLGEGTGALLALPLLRAACHLLSDVASLDDVMAGRL